MKSFPRQCCINLQMLLFFLLVWDAAAEIVDLSYTYDQYVPSNPKVQPFELKIVKKGKDKFGQWVEMNKFCTSEHSGTHMDAPVHYSQGKWAIDQIPMSRLIRVPAVVIDLSRVAKTVPNYAIKPEDLERWESVYGTIPDGAVVFIHTGWGKRAKDPKRYSGLDQYGKLNFPGLNKKSAEWLAKHGDQHGHEKGIIGVGIDALSIDVGQAVVYEAHSTLMVNNIYALENVANLEQLPHKDFWVTIAPMKIGGGSGAPVRIFAEVGKDAIRIANLKSCGAVLSTSTVLLFLFVYFV